MMPQLARQVSVDQVVRVRSALDGGNLAVARLGTALIRRTFGGGSVVEIEWGFGMKRHGKTPGSDSKDT
jgi:hypothetical protein